MKIRKKHQIFLEKLLSSPPNRAIVYIVNKYKGKTARIASYGLYKVDNLINDLSLMHLIKIRNIKKHSKEFVVLYLGADSDSFGLGVVLAILNQRYFVEHKCTSISALIHKGNTPEKYYSDMVSCQSNYVLLSKELK